MRLESTQESGSLWSEMGNLKIHPAAKGVRQKESGKKSDEKKWQKRQKKWPKSDRKRPENEKKWSNSFCRTPFAAPWKLNSSREH